METINERFNQLLEDWEMMQKTSGDEGADWAERFERHFYLFVEEVGKWLSQREPKPKTVEEAEALPEIEGFITTLPGPLQLNFLTELEDIIEGNTKKWYD